MATLCDNGVRAMGTVKKKLTYKQNEFVKEYLINGNNGTQAAIKAGYPENSARQIADQNLSKLYIKEEIEVRQKQITKVAEKKFTFTVEQRLKMLGDVYNAGMGQYVDAQNNKRYENLATSKGCVQELNVMLGVDEEGAGTKPVKVFIGVEDAS